MGLEAVVSDIQEKGRREAEAIRRETQEEVEKILKAAQERVATIKITADQEVSEIIRRMIGQEASAANLIVKRQVLNVQKDLLDQVFNSTLSALSALPEDFHRQALKRLLQEAAGVITAGTVYVNQRDAPIVAQLIAEKSDFAGYRLGRTEQIEGGIIVESSDGAMKLDLSYRTFLDQVWEVGLKDASDILFA